MSGPKSYSYTVDQAALAAAREFEAARAAMRSAREQHARAAAEAEAVRRMHPGVASIATHAALASTASATAELLQDSRALREHTERELGRIRVESRAAFAHELGASLKLRGGKVVSAEDVLRARAPDHPTADRAEDTREQDLARILGRLDPEALVGETLTSAIASLRAAGPGSRSQLLLDVVREKVGEVNQSLREGRERRVRLEQMLAELAGLPGDEVALLTEQLYALLRSGPTSPDMVALEPRVSAAAAAATAQVARDHVATALAETLTSLGYGVGPGFETALAADGVVDVVDPKHPGYAIRVRASHGGTVGYNVVRGPASRPDQASRDAEVESDWCSDVHRLETAMRRSGVHMARTVSTPAGSLPVQVDETLNTTASIVRRARHAREMNR